MAMQTKTKAHSWTKIQTQNTQLEPEQFTDYEKLYLRMSKAFSHLGKEHWGLHCVCGIDYKPGGDESIEHSLRQAWMQLLIEYPGLGMQPNGFSKSPIDLSQGKAILKWLELTFFVKSDSAADDIISVAEPRELPSLYYLSSTSEILFLSQHWRTDALGCCMLLDRFFELLAAGKSERTATISPVKTTSPAMEVAARAVDSNDSEAQEYARGYIDAFHEKAIRSGGLPYQGNESTMPARTGHQELVLSRKETHSIIDACKKHGISVSAACHVALAQTVLSHTSESEKSVGYTTVMAVNMRPYLPPPYNSRAHACQSYVASVTPTVSAESDFMASARALTHEYRSWCTDRLMRSLKWIYKYHYAKTFGPRDAVATNRIAPPSGVTLSSLGVVDRHLKGDYGPVLRLTSFRFGVTMMTRQMLLYVWTFQDKLTLSLDYNEAYHTEQMAGEVLREVKYFLFQGCNIPVNT